MTRISFFSIVLAFLFVASAEATKRNASTIEKKDIRVIVAHLIRIVALGVPQNQLIQRLHQAASGCIWLTHSEASSLRKQRHDEPVALYYLYRLFLEGGCNAMKQWGLFE